MLCDGCLHYECWQSCHLAAHGFTVGNPKGVMTISLVRNEIQEITEKNVSNSISKCEENASSSSYGTQFQSKPNFRMDSSQTAAHFKSYTGNMNLSEGCPRTVQMEWLTTYYRVVCAVRNVNLVFLLHVSKYIRYSARKECRENNRARASCWLRSPSRVQETT